MLDVILENDPRTADFYDPTKCAKKRNTEILSSIPLKVFLPTADSRWAHRRRRSALHCRGKKTD